MIIRCESIGPLKFEEEQPSWSYEGLMRVLSLPGRRLKLWIWILLSTSIARWLCTMYGCHHASVRRGESKDDCLKKSSWSWTMLFGGCKLIPDEWLVRNVSFIQQVHPLPIVALSISWCVLYCIQDFVWVLSVLFRFRLSTVSSFHQSLAKNQTTEPDFHSH